MQQNVSPGFEWDVGQFCCCGCKHPANRAPPEEEQGAGTGTELRLPKSPAGSLTNAAQVLTAYGVQNVP